MTLKEALKKAAREISSFVIWVANHLYYIIHGCLPLAAFFWLCSNTKNVTVILFLIFTGFVVGLVWYAKGKQSLLTKRKSSSAPPRFIYSAFKGFNLYCRSIAAWVCSSIALEIIFTLSGSIMAEIIVTGVLFVVLLFLTQKSNTDKSYKSYLPDAAFLTIWLVLRIIIMAVSGDGESNHAAWYASQGLLLLMLCFCETIYHKSISEAEEAKEAKEAQETQEAGEAKEYTPNEYTLPVLGTGLIVVIVLYSMQSTIPPGIYTVLVNIPVLYFAVTLFAKDSNLYTHKNVRKAHYGCAAIVCFCIILCMLWQHPRHDQVSSPCSATMYNTVPSVSNLLRQTSVPECSCISKQYQPAPNTNGCWLSNGDQNQCSDVTRKNIERFQNGEPLQDCCGNAIFPFLQLNRLRSGPHMCICNNSNHYRIDDNDYKCNCTGLESPESLCTSKP